MPLFLRVLLGVLCVLLSLPAHAQLTITVQGDLTPQQTEAFRRAALQWESRLSDPVALNIRIEWSSLLPVSVYATTLPTMVYEEYGTLRERLSAKGGIGEQLPDTLSATLPTGFSLLPLVGATKANLKALGVSGLDARFGTLDAVITVNSRLHYDYDNRDGVATSTLDWETLIAHEIGHSLGFISSVDQIDALKRARLAIPVSASVLDLFRFQGPGPTTDAEFAEAARFLDTGGEAVLSDAAHSYRLSTGTFTGDGFSASHYKAGTRYGVMGPGLAYETVVEVSEVDAQVLGMMGWTVRGREETPEPVSGWLFVVGALPLLWRTKQKSVYLPP